MFKNVASQKVAVFAWDNAAGAAKTGDAGNITAQISTDGGACAALSAGGNPAELDVTDAPGVYIWSPSQAETNGNMIVIYSVSATSDIVLRPAFIYTQTVMRGTDSANTTTPDAAGTAASLHSTTNGKVDALNNLSTGETGDAVLDEVVEGAYTLRQILRLVLSRLCGKASGGGTTEITFRDTGDGTDRIVMTVDSNGDRSAVVLDAS